MIQVGVGKRLSYGAVPKLISREAALKAVQLDKEFCYLFCIIFEWRLYTEKVQWMSVSKISIYMQMIDQDTPNVYFAFLYCLFSTIIYFPYWKPRVVPYMHFNCTDRD